MPETIAAPQHTPLALQRLVARHLLDPGTSVPTDSAKLKAHVRRPLPANCMSGSAACLFPQRCVFARAQRRATSTRMGAALFVP